MMFKKENQCTLTPEKINKKAAALLKKMTLKEKVWLLNGNWDPMVNMIRYKNAYNPTPIATNGLKRLGIAPIKFTDGPRGRGDGPFDLLPGFDGARGQL